MPLPSPLPRQGASGGVWGRCWPSRHRGVLWHAVEVGVWLGVLQTPGSGARLGRSVVAAPVWMPVSQAPRRVLAASTCSPHGIWAAGHTFSETREAQACSRMEPLAELQACALSHAPCWTDVPLLICPEHSYSSSSLTSFKISLSRTLLRPRLSAFPPPRVQSGPRQAGGCIAPG